jgi:FAD/FMN-containing dehydrogenase
MKGLLSWGRYPWQPQWGHALHWPDDAAALLAARPGTTLAYGMGRSYGDVCLAASDEVVVTQGMDRLLAADWETGVVLAQAGLTLEALIHAALPHGWFPAVTPGTKFVTLGGAVANDVHGKNHHVTGTFGRHVRRLHLLRSDQGLLACSSTEHPELFAATVGGVGMTGLILTVELQLRRVASGNVDQRAVKFRHLDEFFELSAAHDARHEYTVAWIDCLASGASAGRGVYFAGDHANEGGLSAHSGKKKSMPFDPPLSLVNGLSLRAFNTLYYQRQQRKEVASLVGYDAYFYPLDGLQHWNRMYGRAGFQQYQCVVPKAHGREVMRNLLREIAQSGLGSFLSVLKQCGDIASPGLLSFPLPGWSLALDFPQREANTKLFERLDALVHEAGGRLYPAKDAHMSAAHFQQAYPKWTEVERLRDPKLLSKFWQRVTS